MYDVNNKEEIDQIYAKLSPRADLLYHFVITYYQYIYTARDYGTGLIINMMDVHTLTMIEDNPGITVSMLAKMWHRTKGAVSQTISRLEDQGLIYRERNKDDAKIMHLYATEAGIQLSTAHKVYDNADIMQTQRDLLMHCSLEEVDTFYKVLSAYLKLFEEE